MRGSDRTMSGSIQNAIHEEGGVSETIGVVLLIGLVVVGGEFDRGIFLFPAGSRGTTCCGYSVIE